MKKIVVKKGYTLEVTSWENDGDNYRTKSATYETEFEALMVRDLCKTVFKSSTNNEGGIGNLMEDGDSKAKAVVHKYIEDNPSFMSWVNFDELFDAIMEYNYQLMGGSEYYYSRVCEKVEMWYSPEDIYLDIIS